MKPHTKNRTQSKPSLPFTKTGGAKNNTIWTITTTGETFTSRDLKKIAPLLGVTSKNVMDVLDVMTAKNVFGGKELAITRCGKTVSVTYLSKPSTLKTLRAAPPAGCDVQPISRLEALKTLAMEPTLDGVVLLRAILSPALQYGY